MTRLVLLPGLGTTGLLFDPQRAACPELEVPPWLDPHRAETLPEYGRRMAGALAPGRVDLVLGGVSFGGMVALEMARHLRARAVILIASCGSNEALGRTRRLLANVGSRMPKAAFLPPPPFWRLGAWAFGARAPGDRRAFYDLVRASRPDVVAWGLGAIAHWHPTEGPPCPVRHIHGSDDRLIGAARVNAEVVVLGAGHLLNVSHAAAVNAFLRSVVDGCILRESAPHERERVREFYVACGHSGATAPADRVLVAEIDGHVAGAVRLCVEEGVQVLRTMRVRPDVQRRGIGRAMLRRFATMLADAECFCLPYAHLDSFYGAIGFERVAPEALPPHLAARLETYRRERPGTSVIAMRRPPR